MCTFWLWVKFWCIGFCVATQSKTKTNHMLWLNQQSIHQWECATEITTDFFLWQSINRLMSVFRIDYGSCDTSNVKALFDQTWSFKSKTENESFHVKSECGDREKKRRTIEKWFMFHVIHKTMINRLLPFVPNIQMSLFIYLRSAFATNNYCLGPFFFKFSIAISIDNIFFFILFKELL